MAEEDETTATTMMLPNNRGDIATAARRAESVAMDRDFDCWGRLEHMPTSYDCTNMRFFEAAAHRRSRRARKKRAGSKLGLRCFVEGGYVFSFAFDLFFFLPLVTWIYSNYLLLISRYR